MTNEYLATVVHLLGAAAAGGLIGAERSYHGRPAGFRTHMLVCVAASLLMLVTLYQWKWLPVGPADTVRVDPTRMAQGIMTGIGFLGAGVIFKEGLSVRGLTTAASIWITSAIGILIGVGFYFEATVATILVLGTLSLFRLVERKMPSEHYAHLNVRFPVQDVMEEPELKALLETYGFNSVPVSYRVGECGKYFEYRMVARTRDPSNSIRLARALSARPGVLEFRITMGD